MARSSLEHVIRKKLEAKYQPTERMSLGVLLRWWRRDYPQDWPYKLGSRPYWEGFTSDPPSPDAFLDPFTDDY